MLSSPAPPRTTSSVAMSVNVSSPALPVRLSTPPVPAAMTGVVSSVPGLVIIAIALKHKAFALFEEAEVNVRKTCPAEDDIRPARAIGAWRAENDICEAIAINVAGRAYAAPQYGVGLTSDNKPTGVGDPRR